MTVAPAEPSDTEPTLRVGVVGARRRRQGTGEHLAHFFEAAGAQVVAVAGSSTETAREAAENLRDRHGILANPYGSVGELLDRETIDALVIASPPATHHGFLELGLRAGLHVLCEKPLVWHPGDVAGDVAGFVQGFSKRGRHLGVVEQWPFTLPTWRRLFGDADPRASRSFQMLLCPGSPDPAFMIADSLPHALSVLHHLHPGAAGPPGAVEDVRVTPARSKGMTIHARRLDVEFLFPAPVEPVQCWVRLVPWIEQPRPAAYAFDGRMARRVIREPGYRLALRTEAGGAREEAMPDPLESLVRDFVERVRAGPPFPGNPALAAASAHLKAIHDAALATLGMSASGVAGGARGG